jgi:phage shock protein C
MAEYKVLRRSRSDKIIAGVCGGLADFFDLSPTNVRILYVVGSAISVAFPGIIVYLILWLLIPREDKTT